MIKTILNKLLNLDVFIVIKCVIALALVWAIYDYGFRRGEAFVRKEIEAEYNRQKDVAVRIEENNRNKADELDEKFRELWKEQNRVIEDYEGCDCYIDDNLRHSLSNIR